MKGIGTQAISFPSKEKDRILKQFIQSLIIKFLSKKNIDFIFCDSFEYLRFTLSSKNYLLDHKNFINQLNEQNNQDWFYYTPETTKLIIVKLKKLKYITKGGIKWDKIEERDIVGNIKETRVPSTNIE